MTTINRLIDRYAMPSYLNGWLAGVVVLQLCLYINEMNGYQQVAIGSFVQDSLYLFSLAMLIGIVIVRHIHQTRQDRRRQSSEIQLDAMISMFGTVKHKLNNDMQVVLGNAELAQILINNDGNVDKPVQNITEAANAAVERIEQLSVFSSAACIRAQPFDLNAMLRRSMARLVDEIPPMVNLRLELGTLSSRVIADGNLLSLSLAHLVRQAAISMPHGGEIVLKSAESAGSGNKTRVQADVHIARALRHQSQVTLSGETSDLQHGLNTTKALVERCGVDSVRLLRVGAELVFSMRFSTELHTHSHTEGLLMPQLNGQ